MKAIEKLKEKKDEIKTKIDDHSERISNVLIAAGVGILVTTTAYVIGRWRAAKYATGCMFLAREAGLMKFEPYEFVSFIEDHPQKEVFKDWKRICKMK